MRVLCYTAAGLLAAVSAVYWLVEFLMEPLSGAHAGLPIWTLALLTSALALAAYIAGKRLQ